MKFVESSSDDDCEEVITVDDSKDGRLQDEVPLLIRVEHEVFKLHDVSGDGNCF